MLPFTALTYAGQVRRLRRLARNALAAYGLDGADVRLTPIRYRENAVFRVDAPLLGRRFCLRIHRPDYQTTDALRSELALLGVLRDTGFAVPEPIPTRDGASLAFASGEGVPETPRRVTLLGWTEGRFLRRRVLPPIAMENAGEFLARLHAFARSTPGALPKGFQRPRLDDAVFLRRTLAESLKDAAPFLAPGDREAILRAHAAVAQVRERLGEGPCVYGLLHGDFHRGNFLLGPGGEVRAIDFDDCGWGHFLADIANATESYNARPDGETLIAAFLRGYRRAGDLPTEHEALLPTFWFDRGLTALRWVMARQDNAPLRTFTPEIVAACVESARALCAGSGE